MNVTLPAPLPPKDPQPSFDTYVHRAEDLLGPHATALIVLGGQVYTLRRTRAGKLILTK